MGTLQKLPDKLEKIASTIEKLRELTIFLIGVFLFVFFIVITYFWPSGPAAKTNIEICEEEKKLEIKDKVTACFIDFNDHAIPKIDVFDGHKTIRIFHPHTEADIRTLIFVNDSFYKPAGKFIYYTYRNGIHDDFRTINAYSQDCRQMFIRK